MGSFLKHFQVSTSLLKCISNWNCRDKEKEAEMTPEQVKLLQTRDLNYVVHKRTAEKNKIERLKSGLHLLDSSSPSNKGPFTYDVLEVLWDFWTPPLVCIWHICSWDNPKDRM